MKHGFFAAALVLACEFAGAQPLALPAPPRADVEQRIGAQLPLDVPATDEDGRATTLAAYIDASRPVLLVPGSYRCEQLCGLVMQSLLDSVPPDGVRVVGIGIDPRETPADARARKAIDLDYASVHGVKPDLHLLTFAHADLARITTALGDRFELPRGNEAIAHPATVVLVTPRGAIARYFNGIGIDRAEMRVALADAQGERFGSVSARLALLCAHFDPRAGRLDPTVMNAVRIAALLLVLAVGGWCWRKR